MKKQAFLYSIIFLCLGMLVSCSSSITPLTNSNQGKEISSKTPPSTETSREIIALSSTLTVVKTEQLVMKTTEEGVTGTVAATIPARAALPSPSAAVHTPNPVPIILETIPTPMILRGIVIPEKVSCRYGPGAMYLYLYGLRAGAVQDVIGRTDTGSWVLTRSHGDSGSCWVKTDLLSLNGDVMSLELVYPDKFTLIKSNQGYHSPWGVTAERNSSQVIINWKSDELRPGDRESENSFLYVIETWICRSGQLVFTPIGSQIPQLTVVDELGCQQPSHGRIYFSEKHGYTGPSEIPWPNK
ncbi:MAG: hypothetical protein WCP19_08445 [Chloroflexota bacterium]